MTPSEGELILRFHDIKIKTKKSIITTTGIFQALRKVVLDLFIQIGPETKKANWTEFWLQDLHKIHEEVDILNALMMIHIQSNDLTEDDRDLLDLLIQKYTMELDHVNTNISAQ